MRNIIPTLFTLLLISLSSTGAWCADMQAFDTASAPPAVDYSKESSWLALPDGEDVHPVDVFWVYPTVYMEPTGWLQDIQDQGLLQAAQRTIKYQAGVFTEQANLYAPLYRQMNIAGLSLPEKQEAVLLGFGAEDVWNALRYYLEHYNQGRPFILAGHSQGSNLLTDLMREKWGAMGVENRLVAAYLIGWSVTDKDLRANPALKICQREDDTGCIITYNSVAPGRQSVAPTILPGAVVVNPLSWRTDSELAPASMNLGAVFFDSSGQPATYKGFASARGKEGGLEVVPVDPALLVSPSKVFPEGVYHAYDYSLFHENLKSGVARRVRAFDASAQMQEGR